MKASGRTGISEERTGKIRKGWLAAIAILAWVCVVPIRSADAGRDGRLPPDSKGEMPQTVTLGSLADRYEPVAFDHAAHVDMASGCGDCHHQHGNDQTLGCRQCHSLDPSAFRKSVRVERFRACRECHAGPSPRPDPVRTGLAAAYHRSCFRCHREVGSVGKDPKGCTETCHAAKEAKETAGK